MRLFLYLFSYYLMVNKMKIIKFGGTSLQTPTLINNAINIVNSFQSKVVVVISSIGRKGFPYATDTLIDSLKGSYLSLKEMDRLLSLGETYASLLFSNELNKRHINGYSLSFKEIGINCNKNYSCGDVISLNKEKLKSFFNKYQVVIIPGFIAKSNEGEVITLGRGTSDYTAIIIAKMLEEKEVILFKDVDGIYPTIQYPLTRLKCYEKLSYDEMISLCDISYLIVNRKAIEESKKSQINIVIKNFIINDNQTLISNQSSGRKVVGFNLINNNYLIATNYQDEVINELDEIFKKHHIFIKGFEKCQSHILFSFVQSQGLLIRQVILKTYFSDMVK